MPSHACLPSSYRLLSLPCLSSAPCLQLTNWVISQELEPLQARVKKGPRAASAPVVTEAPLPSLDSDPLSRASAASAGVAASPSASSSSALSSSQFEALLTACATYRLADRALALFEHATHAGWVPTRPALQAVAAALESKLPSVAKDPAARLAAYNSFLPLVQAARLPVDGELAASLVSLLLGVSGASSPTGAASPSPSKSAAAATEAAVTVDALIDEAARLVAELPDAEVARSPALQTLLLGCLRAGRKERAMATLGALQVRRVPLSAQLFNQLMYHEAQTLSAAAAAAATTPLAAVRVYLDLMQDSGVAPDAGTLLSLTHAFLSTPPSKAAAKDGAGVAAFVTSAAASLRVPVSHRVLGLAAFHTAKHGNVRELDAVLRLLDGLEWPADRPKPRWYRKLASFLASHDHVAGAQ